MIPVGSVIDSDSPDFIDRALSVRKSIGGVSDSPKNAMPGVSWRLFWLVERRRIPMDVKEW